MEIDFLSVEDVSAVHANQIEFYGGDFGLRDAGLLASAVAQPSATFGGQCLHGDLFEMAAAYLFHIVMNHPFLDGNKRTGTAAALVSLDLNGVEIACPEGALYDLTVSVATGQADKPAIAAFFRTHAR